MDRLGLLEPRRIPVLPVSAALALALVVGTGFALTSHVRAATPETCPAGTTNVAQFQWDGSAWTPLGATSGIAVSGDTNLARWIRSGGTVSAVVITAGSVTINYTYDPRTWNGAIAASDVESAGGAGLSQLDFCTGALVSPSSGSKISVGIANTASCATVGADGMATVSGTITIVRHRPADPTAPSVAIRIRTTRDNVWSGSSMLGETTTIPGLTSTVMLPGTDTLSVPYSVSFQSGSATSFTNKIEIAVEEAVSGLDRHKYYSATADFGVCSVATATPTPTPSPEGSVSGATSTPTPTPTPTSPPSSSISSTPEGSVQAATGTPGSSVPNTATDLGSGNGSPILPLGFALVFLGSGGILLSARRIRPR